MLAEIGGLGAAYFLRGDIIVSNMSNYRRHLSFMAVSISLAAVACGAGQSLVVASSPTISHPYKASADITSGSLVSLDAGLNRQISLANSNNAPKLVGVAVGNNDSLVEIDATTGLVQVATSGVANTLVTNVNGDIKVGDQIAVSPFSGVGMKALPGSRLIGLAQGTLNDATKGLTSRQVKDKAGTPQTIKVGFTQVSIAIGTAPMAPSEQSNYIQRLAKTLVGHSVSTIRLVLSSIIAIVLIVSLIALVYTSIYGSIVAVGRNPLARSSIFRTLGVIGGMVAVISLLGIGVIYLIVR